MYSAIFAFFAFFVAVAAPYVEAAVSTHLNGGLIVPMIRSNNQSAYYVQISAGTPPQKEYLKVDTGSPTYSFLDSNNPICNETSQPCKLFGTFNNLSSTTSIYAGPNFFDALIDYGSGDFLNDSVNIGGTKVDHMYFGYLTTYGFPERAVPNPATILGFSLMCSGSKSNPTCDQDGPFLLPQLKKAKVIDRMSISIYLGPNDLEVHNSHLLLGGYIDKAKIGGPLLSIPMADPTSQSLTDGQTNNVNVTSLEVVINGNCTSRTYGEPSIGQPVLLDTGAPGSALPNDIYYAIYGAFGGNPSTYNQRDMYQRVDCKYRDPQIMKGTLDIAFGNHGNVSIPLHRLVTPFKNGGCGFGSYSTSGDKLGLFGDDLLRNWYLVYDQDSFSVSLADVKYTDEQDIVPFTRGYFTAI